MLRDEFYRPGGPRGGGHKADIDLEIEQFLKPRLLELEPGASYRGEELGVEVGENPELWWLVDPQDGTAAFLKGFRGSTVSVALYSGGKPRLAVVHSPLYPNHAGDTLSWGRGTPLKRNGQLCKVWSGPFDASAVILVSQAAEFYPKGNREWLKPARYLALPSVAYRLALTAAGEGLAGISLAGTESHDFAAAHALLRAQGLCLIDQSREEPVYDEQMGARASALFAGPKPVVQMLSGRNLKLEGSPTPRARLQPGRVCADDGLLSRARGLWLGQLVGDAFGTQTEFRRGPVEGDLEMHDGNGPFRTMAGQPTDDSEMALALARHLEADGGFEATKALKGYKAWKQSGPFDIGNTVSRGLKGIPNHDSQANGALMRCSPLAFFSRGSQWGAEDAAMTHPNAVCLEANEDYLRVLRALLLGEPVHRAFEQLQHPTTRKWVEEGPPRDYYPQMGWVKIAFTNAFHHLLQGSTFEEGIRQTTRMGGDSDTNAAILGPLLGARDGWETIPRHWVRAVLTCRTHRPHVYWPTDALALAENLLLAGLE